MRRTLLGLAGLATLIAVFYTEENWRGKRAWESCKRELGARGAVLNWSAYIPPAVPDEQNFFKAPKMQEWFTGRGVSELSKRWVSRPFSVVAELTVVTSPAATAPEDADLMLQYNYPALTIATAPANSSNAADLQAAIIPVVILDNVPLTNAIENLARRAELKFSFDPLVTSGWAYPDGTPCLQYPVSVRWTNVTARQALLAVLNNFGLMMVEDPKTGIARVTSKDEKQVYADQAVRERLAKLIQSAIEASINGSAGPSAKASQGFMLVAQSLNPIKPVRIVVRADTTPSIEEIAAFFPAPHGGRLRAEAAGTNSFRLSLNPPEVYSATDYLAWSDPFESDFDLIREALKRPYARMDGDYQRPAAMPIPNFLCVRTTAQMLAQRAQCYLLLGQPDKALRELTLIHDLCHLLEGRPTGKPMTLTAAMINVAVTGLYVQTIADGFRLQAWHEPQLVALGQQLKQISLMPYVAEAFRSEQMFLSRTLEITPRTEIKKMFSFADSKTTFWQEIEDLLFNVAPRGWFYQNMVVHAQLLQKYSDGFDPMNEIVLAHKEKEIARELETTFAHFSPYTFIAAMTTPNFVRAIQALGLHQTMANEALVVCALERYRVVHDQYPDKLDSLLPQFIEKLPHDIIGGQPLKYRRMDDGKFLLYSIGWNEKDDGGQVVHKKDGAADTVNGDWVWGTH
ncbi:MAG: hypothetical protein HY298_12565 [Verrucomicrobia bacterium]|nr:hypothetical protein [Verrucomicrobiota bacterium]